MFIPKFQRNTDGPDGGGQGGGSAAATTAEEIAAQMANPGQHIANPDPNNPPGPAGGNPPGHAGPAGGGTDDPPPFDASKWLSEKSGGKITDEAAFNDVVARAFAEEPEPVKALKTALQSGINPKDYYRIANTDFEAMSAKDKWIFSKTLADPTLTPEVAEVLFAEAFPENEHATDAEKGAREYKLNQAIKESEAQWSDIKNKMLTNPGYISKEAYAAEMQTKLNSVKEMFTAQANTLKELTIKIDVDADGKPLPAEMVKEFKFQVPQQVIDQAIQTALDPFKAVMEGQVQPEQMAASLLRRLVYEQQLPHMIRAVENAAFQNGGNQMLARMNNGEFLGAGGNYVPAQPSTAGNPAAEVAEQMSARQ